MTKVNIRHLGWGLGFVGQLALAPPTFAAPAPSLFDRFHPSSSRTGMFGLESPSLAPHLGYDLGLLGVVSGAPYEGTDGQLLENRVTLFGTASLSLFELLAFGLEAPLQLVQSRGDDWVGDFAGTGVGMTRFSAKLGLLRARDVGFDLALLASMGLPAGDPTLGESQTFEHEVLAGVTGSEFRIIGSFGQSLPAHHYRELRGKVGVGARLDRLLDAIDNPIEATFTLDVATTLDHPTGHPMALAVEALGGRSDDVTEKFQVYGGLAAGLGDGWGQPDGRFLAGLKYSEPEDRLRRASAAGVDPMTLDIAELSEKLRRAVLRIEALEEVVENLEAQNRQLATQVASVETTRTTTVTVIVEKAPQEQPTKKEELPVEDVDALPPLAPMTGPTFAPLGIQIGGFANAAVQLLPATMVGDLVVDELELRFERAWRSRATAHAELQFRAEDARTGLFDFQDVLEEAWVSLDVWKRTSGIGFRLGRVPMPFGMESRDGLDSLTYSRSWTVEAGRPSLGTGIFMEYFKRPIDLSLYVVNGWDVLIDDNLGKSFGARFGFRFAEDRVKLGLAYLGGRDVIPNRYEERVPLESFRHLVDADLLITTRLLTLGAELSWSHQDKGSQILLDRKAQWLSFVALAAYTPSKSFRLTFRYEHADDADASRLYQTRNQILGTPRRIEVAGVALTVESLTAAATYLFSDDIRATFEYRGDFLPRGADPAIFPTNGELTLSRHLLSLALVVAFGDPKPKFRKPGENLVVPLPES